MHTSDLIVLITDHDDFDYNLISREAKLIVDTRGRFNKSNNVIKDSIYDSYNFLINDKYKVKINEKTLERVKNYFR